MLVLFEVYIMGVEVNLLVVDTWSLPYQSCTTSCINDALSESATSICAMSGIGASQTSPRTQRNSGYRGLCRQDMLAASSSHCDPKPTCNLRVADITFVTCLAPSVWARHPVPVCRTT